MKVFFHIKVKSGALQFVVFTGLVIAILLAAFVTLTHVHTLFKKQTGLAIKTIKNVDLGLGASLNGGLSGGPLFLEDETNESVIIKKEVWGIFEKITTTATLKKNSFTKVALLGGSNPDRTALYLKENNQPLIVVGNTRIEGTSFLPKQGVKAGNISGNSYYGTSLIYGNISVSEDELPMPINIERVNNELYDPESFDEIAYTSFKPGKKYANSFLEPTQLMYDSAPIHLTNLELIGNIIIQSESAIIVDPSATLKDVVLIAPKIDIQNNVRGNFQAIATNTIILGTNCELQYPSALVLKTIDRTATEIEEEHIYIGDNSIIKGVVLYTGESTKQLFKPQLTVEENAVIHGELFCEANLELKGTVYGSVYTSGFILRKSGSIYLNHIFNGHIIAADLPEAYAGIVFKNSKKEVIKWLY